MVQDMDPGESDSSGGLFGGRPPLPIIGGAIAAVVIGVILVVVIFAGGGGDDDKNASARPTSTPTVSVDHAGLATGVPSPKATTDLSKATVTAVANLDSVSASDRLVVPAWGIDAPLTFRTVGADGVMPNPDGPDDVAYYNFAAWPGKGGAPGLGGNSVFAGHVDSGFKACNNGTVPPPCTAVFWDIGNLELGDEIEIHLNGEVFTYEVTSNEAVDAATAPWSDIVAATEQEKITLITCGGDFNTTTHEYSSRQVVVAVRVT